MIGVEDFEAVPGLAESIFVVEGVEFLTDLIFSGTLFALLPRSYLVPRLYGKLSPSWDETSKQQGELIQSRMILTPKFIVVAIVFSIIAFVFEALSESDFELGVWEPEFVDMYGNQFIWIIIGVAAICSISDYLFL